MVINIKPYNEITMKTYVVIFFLMLFTSTSLAQSGYMPVNCGTLDQLSEVLVEYEEKPFAVAETSRQTRGALQDNVIFFFVNVKTGTYTVAEKVGDNLYCIISSGRRFNLINKPA